MSLYKYLTVETLKKIISGSIRFTQPSAFNDPFELLPELYVPEDFSQKEIKIRFDIEGERRSPSVGDLEDNFLSEYCSDITSRHIITSLNKEIGILCLSRNSDSLLMWSHYANEYAGAIIEFDDQHSFFRGEIDIEYRTRRPIKDISSYISDNEAIPISELCVKSDQWKYESEVRVIRSLKDCKKVSHDGNFPIFVMDIPQESIKSIILGERTPIKHQRNIWELIKHTNISLSLSAISNRGYEFRNEQIKLNASYPEYQPMISPRTAHIFKDHQGQLGELAKWMIEKHPLSHVVNKTV